MMRKNILTFTAIIICVCVCACASAQTSEGGIIVSDLKLNKTGGDVTVTFKAAVDTKDARSRFTVAFTPILTNGGNSVQLPPITVEGRRARIAAEREAQSRGIVMNAVYTRFNIQNGSTVNYSASIPYQQWMEGAQLQLQKSRSGCCITRVLDMNLLAENLVFVPPPAVAEVVTAPAVAPQPAPTTGDRLAADHPFIAKAGNFMEIASAPGFDLGKFVEANREGSLVIYFPQAISIVNRGFRDNGASLDRIIAAVKAIENSSDSRIVRVVIAGYASPEGGTAFNFNLAANRARAVRQILIDNSSLSTDIFDIYNGNVDWHGLRALVAESDMQHRQQVIDIIDNVPAEIDYRRNTSRRKQLEDLAGGRPYRYMYATYFPDLRTATYIKVYYENK